MILHCRATEYKKPTTSSLFYSFFSAFSSSSNEFPVVLTDAQNASFGGAMQNAKETEIEK